MFLRLKTFLMSCFATMKEGNKTSAVMVSSTQQDPLTIIGKSLQETTLEEFSEDWEKTNDENRVAGLMQMTYPERHAQLLAEI